MTSWKLSSKGKEEDEATGPTEEMRKIVATAQQKSFEAERSLCDALRAHIKCWQSLQCADTKNMNLEKDLEDIQSTASRREKDKVVEAVGG